ncbi:uncharacterized protein [Rutidosis leptorrhynchoides]|uniref:uncharacterized protein isoform X2 n=1 Tax=Rutidosis leptorrhynchoides TaxID=125765 RepID=UPI003A99B7F3
MCLQLLLDRTLPNISPYSTPIDGYFKAGKQDAISFYEEMKLSGLEENNFVLDAFVNNSKTKGKLDEAGTFFTKVDEAMNLLKEMANLQIYPSFITQRLVINRASKIKVGEKILLAHERIIAMGLKPSQKVYNSLITALCRLGMPRKATSALQDMKNSGIFS